jgi:hypothetical protein
MMTQFADAIGPEMLKELQATFGSDVVIPPHSDEVRECGGYTTGEYLWDTLWRFGIVVDNDVASQRSCGDLWRPDGRIANGYYVPDDEDTSIEVYSIDNPPPKVDWSAK